MTTYPVKVQNKITNKAVGNAFTFNILGALRGQVQHRGSSSLAVADAVRAETPGNSGGGTITLARGLYIAKQNGSGIGTAYGVFQEDAGDPNFFAGEVRIGTAGKGLLVKEGSNAKQGTATLVGGSVTVSNTSVTAASRIFLTPQDNATTGALRVAGRTSGTSFTITSSNAGDTGVVAYEIFEPAP